MANLEFSPELLAYYAPLRSSAFSSTFEKDACIDPQGIEFRCGFSLNEKSDAREEGGLLHIPIGTWQVVKIPELARLAPITVIHVRCADGRILTHDTVTDDFVETNENIAKFLDCWSLFKRHAPTLTGCNSRDDELMPQWENFRRRMSEIYSYVETDYCIWSVYFAEGMFPW